MTSKIAAIVEGRGEVDAVPVLLRRLAGEIVPERYVDVPRPHRVDRAVMVATGGIERAIGQVAVQHAGAPVLVLLDADDDCPADLGPRLLSRVHQARPELVGGVVVANREFEAWFLAAAVSLRGRRGLAADLTPPADPERPRDCKGWLSKHRTDRRSYKPAADQVALTQLFDLRQARTNSPSFDKLWRDVERLLTTGVPD